MRLNFDHSEVKVLFIAHLTTVDVEMSSFNVTLIIVANDILDTPSESVSCCSYTHGI